MNSRITFRALFCALVLLSLVALLAFHPSPVAAGPDTFSTTASIWQIVRTPSPDQFNNLLTSISTTGTDNIWAVGQVSVRWDGLKWSAVPVVKQGDLGSFDLNGVAALSSTDVWAAGEFQQNGSTHSVIEHWDGTKWSVVPSPQFSDGGILTGISALSSQDIYAVGWFVQLATNSILPVIEHWDGTSWKNTKTLNTTGTFIMTKISALSDTDIWAVGYTGNLTGSDRTFAMHFDGQRWKIVPTPSVGSGENRLSNVIAIASNDVWAVGESAASTSSTSNTLVEHWDGTAWSVVPSPNVTPSQGNRLYGVGALSSTNVWACGSFFSADGSGRQKTLVEHWDGTQWTISSSPNRGSSDTLFGVATLAPGNVWLAGSALIPPAFKTLVLQTNQGF